MATKRRRKLKVDTNSNTNTEISVGLQRRKKGISIAAEEMIIKAYREIESGFKMVSYEKNNYTVQAWRLFTTLHGVIRIDITPSLPEDH